MPTKKKNVNVKAPNASARTPRASVKTEVPTPAPKKTNRRKATPPTGGGDAAPGSDRGTSILEGTARPSPEAAPTAAFHLETLPLDAIRIDPGLQVRAEGLDEDVVEEYREHLQRATRFPPVEVCRDTDGTLWLFSGFHRIEATKQAGFDEIEANVRPGGKREALLAALSQNATHGLRRSRADVKRAIEVLLLDAHWVTWTDRVIAEHLSLDAKTIGNHRARLATEGKIERHGTRTGKDGRAYDYSKKAQDGPETDVRPSEPIEPAAAAAASVDEPFDKLPLVAADSRAAISPATTEREGGPTADATTDTTPAIMTATTDADRAAYDAPVPEAEGASGDNVTDGTKPGEIDACPSSVGDPRRLIDNIAGRHGLDVWVATGDPTEDRSDLASRLVDLVAVLAADDRQDAQAWLDRHVERLSEVVGGCAPSEADEP